MPHAEPHKPRSDAANLLQSACIRLSDAGGALRWLTQQRMNVIIQRQIDRIEQPQTEARFERHRAQRIQGKIVYMIRISEAAPGTAHDPAIEAAIIGHLHEGDAVRLQYPEYAMEKSLRLGLMLKKLTHHNG